ncbi:NADH:flavin oxidoreductase / NADH oxidase family protein [Azotobacter beijerinckii]|uniref:NADH:flavin oxidoreductase / NADH oxidase family protein n=1 Tax=Azotobacter beijerinckii TaxID=170623 RepID=A0A1H9QCX3_9GAMM|nr:hypothetical protein [Azotobacter beijerinckii]SEJ09416.1 NADH:flavin oxidoreductase / NADH oxidase family protein [Azotobacter beijerinckii]SEJ44059.1 NADH:flavin oxidoreductase / NADH oxidase family protein [Azotobacter beijerinckii]SER58015.1 NADH:flavin oxidoreductase / NADH oxidase family protein [Azotobacter beijerinckii]SFB43146.1 NADH:flavin oxidoreductase / NADH oxidase family protein [Azotobacter beijerinckii]SFL06917.1 NADH:flavin oxidoreductase / NADH oxidase family protein [Azo
MKSRKLPNRIVMSPMTRSRASQPGDEANGLMAECYAQRASAGLIVSEDAWISPMGKGYALIERIGAQRTAIRLSPYGGLFDMGLYADVEETYLYLAQELTRRNLAYMHLMDQRSRGSSPIPDGFLHKFREHYRGTLILAGGMTKELASRHLEDGLIDFAAFGEPFIANLDLVERLRHDWPLLKPDRALSYGGGIKGYTDYPNYQTS